MCHWLVALGVNFTADVISVIVEEAPVPENTVFLELAVLPYVREHCPSEANTVICTRSFFLPSRPDTFDASSIEFSQCGEIYLRKYFLQADVEEIITISESMSWR